VAPISAKQDTEGPRYVQVPVYPDDTEWDVGRRSLPMLAKQSGLGPEGQKVFAETWAARLHAAGQTGIYTNKTGTDISDEAFKAQIKQYPPGASTPAGSVGTYQLEFLPDKHSRMFSDLRQLQRNEALSRSISDPTLRREVLLRLNQVTVGDGEDRTNGAENLLRMAGSGQPEADKVYDAIKTLAASEEMKSNAALKTTELRLDLDKQNQFIGPRDLEGDNAVMRSRVEEVARLAARPGATPDRTEAAWVNRQGSMMLKELGDPQGALHREMVGRFYDVGPEERAPFERSDLRTTIPRWKPLEGDSMRAPTPEELALRRYNQKKDTSPPQKKELAEDPQKFEFAKKPRYILNEKTNQLEPTPSTRFQLESAVRPEGTLRVDTTRYLNKKGVEVKPGQPYSRQMKETRKLPYEGPVQNPTTVRRMRGTAGGVGAIEEFNKWGSLVGDLVNDTTAKKIAERQRLEKAEKDSLNFRVPPRPEELPALKPQLERAYGKQRAAEVMRKLEELSTAFYARPVPGSRTAPR
jgi:hypothetical protein